ncbi:MAG TPA: DUF1905 domain-containing protein [Gemmatimonadales bacterium]|nr:DUF1905 domain-containing protein [Gemmatimonadales bacterium]
MTYRIRAKVWRYPGKGGWHFANVSPKQSTEIRVRFADERRGFGSIPVTVRIGRTTWETSLFPAKQSRTYLFAIKAAVRKLERIDDGDTISAVIEIR